MSHAPTITAIQKLGSILHDLSRTEPGVLPPYTRQRNALRAKLRGFLGVGALAGLGAIYGYFYTILPSQFLIYLVAPLALLGLVIIWVLPDQETAPTRLMVKCFFAFAAVAVLWPDYVALAIPGLPWISMRRLLLFPMILCLLVGLSTSSRFRTQLKEYLEAWPLIPKLLGSFVVIQALSILVAKEKTAAVKDFVDMQIMWTAIFFICVFAFQHKANIHRYLKLLVLCATFLAGVAFLENPYQKVLWADHIPGILKVDQQTLDLFISVRFRDGLYRVKTTFTNPLPYAEYMALVSPVVLYFLIRAQSASARIFLIIIDIVIFWAMSMAQARLGMLGFITGHTLYGLLWSLRRWRTSRISLIGPAMSLAYPAIIAALALAIVSVSSFNNKVLGSQSTQGSNQARQTMFRHSVPLIIRSPIAGYGPRQGAEALGYGAGGFLTIDSYLLTVALDYGVVGFLLYFGLLGLTMVKMLQIIWQGETDDSDLALLITIILSVFVLIKTVLSQEDNNYMPFILMGMMMALVRRAQTRGSIPIPGRVDAGLRTY